MIEGFDAEHMRAAVRKSRVVYNRGTEEDWVVKHREWQCAWERFVWLLLFGGTRMGCVKRVCGSSVSAP